MAVLTKVASLKDVPVGKSLCVETNGRRIAIFNVSGTIFAIDDECTHASGPLSEGEVNEAKVTCPWHGAEFDLKTGEALAAPAFEGVKAYKVHLEGEDIKIEI